MARIMQDDPSQLHQIWVDEDHPIHGKRPIPVGPRMMRKFLGPLLEQIGRFIVEGKEKTWRNPRIEPVIVLKHGSPFTREDRQNDLVRGHREETAAESSLILH